MQLSPEDQGSSRSTGHASVEVPVIMSSAVPPLNDYGASNPSPHVSPAVHMPRTQGSAVENVGAFAGTLTAGSCAGAVLSLSLLLSVYLSVCLRLPAPSATWAAQRFHFEAQDVLQSAWRYLSTFLFSVPPREKK